MKKFFQILGVILAAYIFAYFKYGYIRGYKLIPFIDTSSFFHKKRNSDDNAKLEKELDEAIDYYNYGDYSSAIDLLESLLYEEYYDIPAVKYWLAKSYYNYDDRYNSDAYDLFSEVVDETDSLDSAYLYMGKIDFLDGNYEKAYYNFDKFLEYEPNSSVAYDWFAWTMYNIMDDADTALKYEYISIEKDNKNYEPYYGVAHFLEIKADNSYDSDSTTYYYKKALEFAQKSIELDTEGYSYPYYYAGYAAYKIKYYSLAADYFKTYIDKHGDDEDTYYYIAKSYMYKGKADSTLKYADILIDNYDVYPEYYYIKGKAYLLKRDYENAANYFYKAYDTNTEDDYAHTYLLLAAKYAGYIDNSLEIDYLNEYLDVYDNNYGQEDSIRNVINFKE